MLTGDRIAGCTVHAVIDDTPIYFERRRYGHTTFVWLYAWNGAEWTYGDPWQKITPSRQEIREEIQRRKERERVQHLDKEDTTR